jgi:hypothetical protein
MFFVDLSHGDAKMIIEDYIFIGLGRCIYVSDFKYDDVLMPNYY